MQSSKWIPVATFAIDEAAAVNTALHALANLALYDDDLSQKILAFRVLQTESAKTMKLPDST